jgi:Mg2+/citrate symporter
MNQKKYTATKKQTQLIAVAIIAASVITAAMIIGINNGQNIQKAMAQEVKTVSPNQSINKEFWINTVHLDGMTNTHVGMKCDTCAQNTPTHPAEQPPKFNYTNWRRI